MCVETFVSSEPILLGFIQKLKQEKHNMIQLNILAKDTKLWEILKYRIKYFFTFKCKEINLKTQSMIHE